MNEETLVARCRRADREAWDLLLTRHAPAILFHVRDYLRRYGRACAGATEEDLFGEVVVELLRDNAVVLRTWGRGYPLRLVLRLVSRSVCYRELVERRERLRRDEEILPESIGVVRDPGEPLSRGESIERLASAIDTLEPAERLPLLLVEVDGVPREEAAYRLGLTPETVSQRIHRAKEKVRDVMRRDAGTNPPENLSRRSP
ncbi:MAG: sigma-70 family RNA polymerase sigma factor [Planctomycetes bacterium]|nr:sigma-70 family RNA polymerase sigma factor [Planctomycetota bacterium]